MTIQETGEITIHSENIFPIIKKWLYSEKDIFLRELVSNAFDAINKFKTISLKEKLEKPFTQGRIDISIDEGNKSIKISDNGLGMDAEEIKVFINQIAFSGAEDFLKKYQDNDEKNQIIGHFGLGFYSAFMVANLVEIESLSYKKDALAICWSCDGSTKFSLKSGRRTEVGTDIILHINEENLEYLNEARLTELIKKYANFLPVEIHLNGKLINDHNPLWLKAAGEIKPEEYQEFYQKLFPYTEPAIFWIHLNVDYPFNLQGILYFPRIVSEADLNKGMVKLFCQQVYVTDEVIIPEFLTMLRGVIDCPDIPLNVSRSFLQNEPHVQKISKFIVKKIAEKLTEIYKTNKSEYEKHWQDINTFIKFGMLNNDDFYDKMKDFVIFRSSLGYSTTIPEYLERNKEKLDKTILYCLDQDQKATYLSLCKEQNLEVIFLDSMIDTHFIHFLESKTPEIKYLSVDAELLDHLVEKEGESKIVDPTNNKTAKEKLEGLFKDLVNDEKLKIKVENLKTNNLPALLLEGEHIKRLKNFSQVFKKDMPLFDDFTLVINANSEIIKKLVKLQESQLNPGKVDLLGKYIVDLAKLNHNKLSQSEKEGFLARSNEVLSLLC
ncbi:MAG: molecular chaperone HtpG [Candidatus Margulisiibacteriota bacterium]|jgi:molecular chaperone HtpG